VSDHPVCGAKVGFAGFFLMPQPPLLYQAELSKLVLKEGTEKGLSLCIRSAKRPSFAIKEEESAP